jgi:hypothetical protein
MRRDGSYVRCPGVIPTGAKHYIRGAVHVLVVQLVSRVTRATRRSVLYEYRAGPWQFLGWEVSQDGVSVFVMDNGSSQCREDGLTLMRICRVRI